MIYKFQIKVEQKVINCRAFTFGEFQSLIEAKTDGRLAEAIYNVIRDCTDIDVSELPRHTAELIFLKVWIHSLNRVNIDHVWVCGECGAETPVTLNIDSAYTTSPDTDLFYDLGQVKMKFRYPRIFEDDDLMQMIITCTEYIVIGNDQYTLDDLDETDFDKVLTMINDTAVTEIIDMLLAPSVVLAVPIKCSCGESGVHKVVGLHEFFKLL